MKFPYHFLLSLLFIFPILQVNAQRDYDDGDVVHILARSGLNMRTSPELKAAKVGKIPFRTPVDVVGYGDSPKAFSYEGIDGHWLEIDFDGQKGWVFDGFVSKYPVSNKDRNFYARHYVETYFEKEGEPELVKIYSVGGANDMRQAQHYVATFKGRNVGLDVIDNSDDEGMTDVTILRLSGVGLHEAFVLGKALDSDYSTASIADAMKGEEIKIKSANEYQLETWINGDIKGPKGELVRIVVNYRHEAGSCWMEIRKEFEGSVDLEFGCYAD